MRFVVLLHQDEQVWRDASPTQREEYYRRHDAFAQVTSRTGCTILAGEALAGVETATTVRRRGEQVSVTEGPFAETAEQLGGFYLVEAPHLDAVIEASRELPEYTVEIRPAIDVA
ncbi:hypothetical protein J4G33_13875 [Actinotalea sp. BY-33]|uniref:YCII-related domain-containing protein n=1 Tax=Actinotalea soli TaxID=2819234 RepID=A0A939LX68_9CELL|nr:YciI family protein [Actinotalea soli]MBO1752897.1 hypothetical protein [Actinotalea soli]